MSSSGGKRRVGVVGYGALGKYLAHAILKDAAVGSRLELAFVWNRTADRIREDADVPDHLILESLEEVASRSPDLIVEVAHPSISRDFGAAFLRVADYFVGSPTALADAEVEARLREAAAAGRFGMYIPAGALWGVHDIQKAANRGMVAELCVTMKKHPTSLKLRGELRKKLEEAVEAETDGEVVLYDGPARQLCPLAPNNVNTIACAAIAAHTLGFDGTRARLISDRALQAHVIDIELAAPPKPDGSQFRVSTTRYNPATGVTGSATFASFLSSMLAASGRGPGVHFA